MADSSCDRVPPLDADAGAGPEMTAGTECREIVLEADFSHLARRNNSLTSVGRLFVFGFIFVVSVGIAAGFAIAGAWLILPFTALEMLVLYWAFRYVERHSADYELIQIDGDQLNVERFDGGSVRRQAFNRYWARLIITRDGSRLALRSHGREFEIGRVMSNAQRLRLARALTRHLRGAR